MQQLDRKPPKWFMRLILFLVHPNYREEIEGDLLEKFQNNCQKYGHRTAQRKFLAELFSVLRPALILNFKVIQLRHWIAFLMIGVLIAIASMAPFFPGPSNEFAINISKFAHALGYIGISFIPFGLAWLIVELRNKKDQKLNWWSNGYYFSWLALSPLLAVLPMQLAVAIFGDGNIEFKPFFFILPLIGFFIYRIQKLKRKTEYKFNPVPLYIVFVPLIALFTYKLAVESYAVKSREEIIAKMEPLVIAISQYRSKHGQYPQDLRYLDSQTHQKFYSMGLTGVFYEPRKDNFQLSFERKWHWYATEVVVYNTNGPKAIRAHSDIYSAKKSNWWYYLAD
jgi:hypothetical protein